MWSQAKKVHLRLFWCCLFVPLACCTPKPGPQIASSAGSTSYAVEYPTKLQSLVEAYRAELEEAGAIYRAFSSYPGDMSIEGETWLVVLRVLEYADKEGRSGMYADYVAENAHVRAFFKTEKDTITRRINIATKTAAQKSQCKCTLNAYGRIVYALNNVVKQRLEARQRAVSETHRRVDRARRALGSKNAAALERGAEKVSRASYLVFIGLQSQLRDIVSLIEEGEEAKATLDEALASEKDRFASLNVTKNEANTIRKWMADIETARSAVDLAVEKARGAASTGAADLERVKLEYEDAFEKLSDEIFNRASPNAE
jgi:chromosome segregation ATPase